MTNESTREQALEPVAGLAYRPSLDGLRSLAVYLVVLFHAGTESWQGGFIGLDLFFVLSVFLFTGILMAEFAQHNHIRLWAILEPVLRELNGKQ